MKLEDLAKAQENYEQTLEAIEKIILTERSYLFEIPRDEDVLILLSGGLDSVVMVDWVAQKWQCKIHPLFIKRGARAQEYEERAFAWYCQFYEKRLGEQWQEPIIIEQEIPPHKFKDQISKERRKNVGLPLRNSTMQNYAIMAAVARNDETGTNIRTVLSGSVAEDYRCPELSLLSLRAQTLSTCIQLGQWQWQITSPMVEPTINKRPMDKRHLIHWAKENGIPLTHTRSCFSQEKTPCKVCSACLKRERAFAAAENSEPTSLT